MSHHLLSAVQVLIPARKNSKRFPKKNKALLNGKPLIVYSIEYAIQEGISLSQIWVNSDDQEILEIARNYHVQVFNRNENLAQDLTPTVAVLQDHLDFFKRNKIICETVILLQVTNPFRPKGELARLIEEFYTSNRSSLCTFSPLNKKFGKITDKYFIPENYSPGQRMQDLAPLYYENGCIYIAKSSLVEQGKIIGEDVLPIVFFDVLSTIDIDEYSDLQFAEALLKITNENI
jgi:CMP-N-acetylneuraminic acid synthetase